MCFNDAVELVGSIEIPDDGPSLVAALRCHDRYTARLARSLASFERGGEWAIAGYTSATAWLRDVAGMTRRDAAVLMKLGQRMHDLPAMAAAWVDGRISGGQVQAVCAQVIDRHLRLFQEHEAELVETFAALTVDETIQVMAEWRKHADAIDEGSAPDAERCEARLSPTLDDRGLLSASLDAEGFALATAALSLADSNELDQAAPQRRGQALKDVFRFFLDNQNSRSGGRHRPHLNIVVRAETIGTDRIAGHDATTGMTLSPATIERLLCDCNMHRVMTSAGSILDYGRSTKTPPVNLYNAVVVRDQHCRFAGCDRPASWCDAHHVKHWTRDQGVTAIGNLVLLCARHHGVVHRRGWSARLLASGEFEATDPTGRTRTSRPPGAVQQVIPDRYRAYDDFVDPFADHLIEAEQHARIRARLQELKQLRVA